MRGHVSASISQQTQRWCRLLPWWNDEDCFYFIESKRLGNWKPKPDIQKKIDVALTGDDKL